MQVGMHRLMEHCRRPHDRIKASACGDVSVSFHCCDIKQSRSFWRPYLPYVIPLFQHHAPFAHKSICLRTQHSSAYLFIQRRLRCTKEGC
jgi:hypothetical protein